MDIRQLRYFSAIAEEKQISRAAKNLHMAQPPLSQQLKLLEQELGVTLVERKGKNLEITPPGKVLYKRAQDILQQLEDAILEVKETAEGLRGTISIGAAKSAFSYLPERIKHFCKRYPSVTFKLREGDTFNLEKYIRNREIDLALVRLPLDAKDDLSLIRLPDEPFIAVLPKQWEMANSFDIKMRMSNLRELPLLLLHRVHGIGQYELIIEECKRHGFEPNVLCECPDVTMLLSLVSAGVGISIVPKSTLSTFHLKNIKAVDIEDSSLLAKSAIIWLKDRYLPKTVRLFIETFHPLDEWEEGETNPDQQ